MRLSRILDKRKDGSPGALRIDYGDPRKPEKPIAWLWKFIDGGKTAVELYGRALVVIAAEQPGLNRSSQQCVVRGTVGDAGDRRSRCTLMISGTD